MSAKGRLEGLMSELIAEAGCTISDVSGATVDRHGRRVTLRLWRGKGRNARILNEGGGRASTTLAARTEARTYERELRRRRLWLGAEDVS